MGGVPVKEETKLSDSPVTSWCIGERHPTVQYLSNQTPDRAPCIKPKGDCHVYQFQLNRTRGWFSMPGQCNICNIGCTCTSISGTKLWTLLSPFVFQMWSHPFFKGPSILGTVFLIFWEFTNIIPVSWDLNWGLTSWDSAEVGRSWWHSLSDSQ